MASYKDTSGTGKGYAKCKPGDGPNARNVAKVAVSSYFTKDTILNHLSGLSDKDAINALEKLGSASPDDSRLGLLKEKHALELELLRVTTALKRLWPNMPS